MKSEKIGATSSFLIYKPLEDVVVRFPLLPVETYPAFAAGQPVSYTELEDRIRYAIMVGSQTLAASLVRKPAKEKDLKKDQSKLMRYLIRMSTRCTPYGMFAGMAMAKLAGRTELSLADITPVTWTRPDMEFLSKFINKVESTDAIRRQLRVSTNPTIYLRGERVYLQERLSAGKAEVEPRVSIRATRAVKTVLELARGPILYSALAEKLAADNPDVGGQQIEQLLNSLLEQTILMTELRPPLTTANPVQHVLDVLGIIPAAAAEKERLQVFLSMAKECDAGSFAERLAAFPKLKLFADDMASSTFTTAVQVDAVRTLKGGTVARLIADEVARAAETMLRITPYPGGYNPLQAYQDAFVGKYGYDREVPVLELMDPNFGLGVPGEYSGAGGESRGRASSSMRDRLLVKLAAEAIRDHRHVLELDDEILKALTTWSPENKNAPVSLDVCVFVAAKSPEALDAGDFHVVIGPNLGASSAGKMLGRFAHLAGDGAHAVLRDISAVEKKHIPDRLWAELAYLPRKYRAGNVSVRPVIQEHEILLGVAPGVAPGNVIPINELLVSVKNGHFCVRWSKRPEPLVISSGHMLNTYGAPSICRFLSDIGKPAQASFMSFSWGPASGFAFLPRVQVGKTVLAPAQWCITDITFDKDVADSAELFSDAFKKWQTAWNLPRYIYLTNADNRLLLDTHLPVHLEEVREELKHAGELTLQEVVPSLEQAWVPGPDGHYLMEMVVSLVPAQPPVPVTESFAKVAPVKAENGFLKGLFKKELPKPGRSCPPGSDWLFVKLYCGRELEEDLLMECKSFVAEMLGKKYADESFFIRYSDPAPHIRLRFRGEPKRLTSKLYPQLCSWAMDLQAKDRCLQFVLDTYERETERYGGASAITTAEQLFAVDSETIFGLLSAERERKNPQRRIITSIASLHNLFAGMGLDSQTQIAWCKKYVTSWDAVSKEYRENQKQLREALSDTGKALGNDVAELLAVSRKRLQPIAKRYNSLENSGQLGTEYWAILRSILHMHCNRLLGSNEEEQKALGLLYRTLQSLAAMQEKKVPAVRKP